MGDNAQQGQAAQPIEKRLPESVERAMVPVNLIRPVASFCTENGLYQESDVDIVMAEAIKAEDLRLVCYERLVNEPRFAP